MNFESDLYKSTYISHPYESTYISDPYAKFAVSSSSYEYGSGIQGFYTSEYQARTMAEFFTNRGDENVTIARHNPNEYR